MIQDVNDGNVKSVVSNGLVLLDVWAPWCGPCKTLHPVLEEVDKEFEGVTIAKINAETDLQFAQELGVRGIPALFVYKDGQIVEQWTGFKSKDAIIEILNKHK